MRKDAREAAFKIIFAEQFGSRPDSRFRTELYKKSKLTEEERVFAQSLVSLTEEHYEELSALLGKKVERYAEERIYPVDRAILLVALAEILYVEDVPPVVSVNEAVGLARVYSTEHSAGFVNGVLAGVINE